MPDDECYAVKCVAEQEPDISTLHTGGYGIVAAHGQRSTPISLLKHTIIVE